MTDEILNSPPQDLTAEEMLLGAIGLDACDHTSTGLIGTLDLEPADFYKALHQRLFSAAIKLHREGNPVDVIGIKRECGDEWREFARMVNAVATTANAKYHAGVIKECARKRGLIHACREVMEAVLSLPLDELISSLRLKTTSLLISGGEIVSYREIAKEVMQHVEARHKSGAAISGISFGFAGVDEWTDGLQPEDLVIIGARPSMGKSAFAMHIAENCGVPVGVLELEMSRQQLGQRSLSALSNVDMWRLRKGFVPRETWPGIMKGVERMAMLPIHVTTTAFTIGQIEKTITQMVLQHGCQLIILDYLQLASASGQNKNREREVAEISRLLKMLAKQLKVPVIALSQLNRNADGRRPTLADLRESGAIEQDADVIAFLYCDNQKEQPRRTELIFAKGRNMGTGTQYLNFHADRMQWEEIND